MKAGRKNRVAEQVLATGRVEYLEFEVNDAAVWGRTALKDVLRRLVSRAVWLRLLLGRSPPHPCGCAQRVLAPELRDQSQVE